MKKTLGWLFATLGCIAGMWLLAYVGAFPGPGAYAVAAPPELSYSATHSDWSLTLCLLSMGLLSILASLLALRRARAASLLLLVPAALLVTTWAVNLPSNAGKLEPLPIYEVADLPFWAWLSLLVVPGFFWYLSAGFRWPPTLSSPVAWWKATTAVALISISVLAGVVVMDWRMGYFVSCHVDVPLFASQVSPDQAVFIGRVLRSGHKHPKPESRTRRGIPSEQWALVRVEKEHWGLPWWDKKLVLLYRRADSTTSAFPSGEQFFVDGYRQPGALTRFLPILGTNCTRTRRLDSAEFELRILQEGAPRNGVRIVGHTVRLNSERKWEPAPRAELVIHGAAGRLTIVSDEMGVFDTGEIPPGWYQVYAAGSYAPACRWYQLKIGEVRDCSVNTEPR